MPDMCRPACKADKRECIKMCQHYGLSEIETAVFISIAQPPVQPPAQSCREIKKSLRQHKEKEARSKEALDESDPQRIHPYINKMNCFLAEASKLSDKSKAVKTVALLINDWPWQVIESIQKHVLLRLITTVAAFEKQITTVISKYNSPTTEHLLSIDVQDVLVRKTGTAKTRAMDRLCSKFLEFETFSEKAHDKLKAIEKQIEKAFVELKIGKFDETRGYIEETKFKIMSIQLCRIQT